MPARYRPLVSLPKEEGEQAKWRWFPKGEEREFQFNESLRPLEAHRKQLTVFGGLSRPNGRRMGGHDTGDTFLTGTLLNTKFLRNTVSCRAPLRHPDICADLAFERDRLLAAYDR